MQVGDHEARAAMIASSDSSGPGRRLRCLDGLRGLLATHVLIGHLMPLAAVPAAAAWLRLPFLHGQAAVDVFFILSGLVITRSIERHGSGARFLQARFWRIFPVYLAVLALAVPVQTLPSGLDQIPWASPEASEMVTGGWPPDGLARLAAHLTMTHGLFPDGALPYVWISFVGSAWSLSTEWQFYVVIALAGGARRGPWLLACGFLTLAAAGAAWHAEGPAAWQFSRAFLPNKAGYFALGIASAGLLGGGARLRYALVLGTVLALCAGGGQADKLLPPLVWTACLAAELGWRPLRPLARLLTSRPLQWLGAVSFGLYLVNQPLQKLLALAWLPWVGDDGWLFDAVWLPGAIALPMLAAWQLHERIELPGIAFGRGATSRRPELRRDLLSGG
jgi:peptidoglycan/LPS O-acetylase OafA/YrhL